MRPELGSKFRRLRSESGGAVALEFGLISPLFLILLCVWIEICLTLFMQASLNNAARDASRLIKTGTATETSFKADLCARTSSLLTCDNISYKVQSGTSFSGLTLVANSGSGTLASTGFDGGSSGSDMLVQVAYSKPAFFGSLLSATKLGSTILISSTLVFQNENY